MNDRRRLELGRYLDGELPPDRHAEVARLLPGDRESRLYLDRLARLRDLARSHEGSASRVVGPPPPRPRTPRVRAAMMAALAASVAAAVIWRGRAAFEVPGASSSTSVAPTPIVARSGRHAPIPEIELYTWANQDRRNPETAANAVLLASRRAGRRPAVVEVLALDLANATPALAEELEPLALLHRSPIGGWGRTERHGRRPRSAAPGA